MTNVQSRPLGFLDLPVELRLMVYKLLPNRTTRTRYVKRDSDGTSTSSFTTITYTAPTAILATCKAINNEAAAILLKTTQQLLPGAGPTDQYSFRSGTAPRMETEISALDILGAPKGPIKAAIDWYTCVQMSPSADFDTFSASRGYDLSSLLQEYEYVMEDGTSEEGVRRLLNFIRKSGCMLHNRRTNVSLSNFSFSEICWDAHPSRTFDIAVSKGTGNTTEMVEAVEAFGGDLGSCTPTRDIRVQIETLTSASRGTSIAVRVGRLSIEMKLITELSTGAVYLHPVIALGQLMLDKYCKKAYDKFWGEGEWAL